MGNYVLLKDRLKRLGISPKFKPVFERIPFKILKTSTFNVLMENQFDLSTTVRAIEDLKLIKIINDNDYILAILPKEIIDLMQLITSENIKEEILKTVVKRSTRQMKAKDKELNEFLETMFEDDFDNSDDHVKTVRFLEDEL